MGEPQRRMRMLGSSIRRPGDEQELHFTNASGDDVIMERGYYRDSMMLPAIKAATDPDDLGARLFEALRDSFGPDIVEDAYRLISIDPNAERSHCTYAQALLQIGDLDRAASVLDAYSSNHPPSAWAFMIRSIIAAQRDDWTDALQWAGEILKVDPDYADGLARLAGCAAEVGGDKLKWEYVEWAAQIPGCWRAVRALADRALAEQGIEAARPLYVRLAASPGEKGEGLLVTVAQLAQAGDPSGAIDIALPRYEPERHGAGVGFNLLQACIDAGRVDDGERLRQRMLAVPTIDRTSLEHYGEALQQRRS